MCQNISQEVILFPDIADIIWKYIDLKDFFKTALISKIYYDIIKKISNNKIYYIFKEKNINEYLLYYTIYISYRYKYNFKNKKIINFKNKISLYYLENHKNNEKILLKFVELSLHSLNKNYKELYNAINSINYCDDNISYEAYINMFHFIVSQQDGLEHKSLFISSKNYSSDTKKLYRISIALLLFELNNNVIKKLENNKYEINKIGRVLKVQKVKCNDFLYYFNENGEVRYPKYIKNIICDKLKYFIEY